MADPIKGIPDPPPINTLNEYALSMGENLPNHSQSLTGRGKFIRSAIPELPTFRTKQAAFRFAAWLINMAEILPDEEGEHTFEEVNEAIRNT